MSTQVKILFFAKSREIVGKQVEVFNVPKKLSYERLLEILTEKFCLEKIKNNIILAINEEYCEKGQTLTLKEGDEIAVIPPLSGG